MSKSKQTIIAIIAGITVFASINLYTARTESQKLCGVLPAKEINGVLYCKHRGSYQKQSKLAKIGK
jgi:hypothetical protein